MGFVYNGRLAQCTISRQIWQSSAHSIQLLLLLLLLLLFLELYVMAVSSLTLFPRHISSAASGVYRLYGCLRIKHLSDTLLLIPARNLFTADWTEGPGIWAGGRVPAGGTRTQCDTMLMMRYLCMCLALYQPSYVAASILLSESVSESRLAGQIDGWMDGQIGFISAQYFFLSFNKTTPNYMHSEHTHTHTHTHTHVPIDTYRQTAKYTHTHTHKHIQCIINDYISASC